MPLPPFDEEINQLLTILCKHQETTGFPRDDWRTIVHALYTFGAITKDFDTWRARAHEFSKKRADKYNEETTDMQFDEGSKFGIAAKDVLTYFARQVDPAAYRAIAEAINNNLSWHVTFEQDQLRDYVLRVIGDDIQCFKGMNEWQMGQNSLPLA